MIMNSGEKRGGRENRRGWDDVRLFDVRGLIWGFWMLEA
jgi:hypothetical protein